MYAAARVFGTLAIVVVLAGCGGSGPGIGTAGYSPAPIPSVTPGVKCLGNSPNPGAEVIRFPSPNGASLGGVLLGTGPAGVVLAHQSPGDLCDWWFCATRLAGLGYRVLAFDFNGTASSSPSAGSPGHAEFDVDVLAAAGVLRDRGATAVGGVAPEEESRAAQPVAFRVDQGIFRHFDRFKPAKFP